MAKAKPAPKAPASQADHPYTIGANYFIRAIPFHYTGRLVEVYDKELVIEDAAWIADDGRFMQAVETGSFSEVEPFPDGPVIIGRATITDAKIIPFALPRSQK